MNKVEYKNFEIEIDSDTYSEEAVLSTSYWFAKDFIISVKSKDSNKTLNIESRNCNSFSKDNIDEILIRLTDEELRKRFRQQFKEIETLIVKKAFAVVEQEKQRES